MSPVLYEPLAFSLFHKKVHVTITSMQKYIKMKCSLEMEHDLIEQYLAGTTVLTYVYMVIIP